MIAPELLAISGVPSPLVSVMPSRVPLFVVSTLPSAAEAAPVTSTAPFASNGYT